jgi:hypothetical protein
VASGLAVLVVVLVAAWVLHPRATHTVTGTVAVHDRAFEGDPLGDLCDADDASSGVSSSRRILVHDERGTTIATGTVKATGKIVNRDGEDTGSPYGGWACRLGLTIADVPAASFYRIEIGTMKPTELSATEFSAQDWKLDLTIGADTSRY